MRISYVFHDDQWFSKTYHVARLDTLFITRKSLYLTCRKTKVSIKQSHNLALVVHNNYVSSQIKKMGRKVILSPHMTMTLMHDIKHCCWNKSCQYLSEVIIEVRTNKWTLDKYWSRQGHHELRYTVLCLLRVVLELHLSLCHSYHRSNCTVRWQEQKQKKSCGLNSIIAFYIILCIPLMDAFTQSILRTCIVYDCVYMCLLCCTCER